MSSGGVFHPANDPKWSDSATAKIATIAAELDHLVAKMETELRRSGFVTAGDAERLHELRMQVEQLLGDTPSR